MNKNQAVCRTCNEPILWIEDKFGAKRAMNKKPTLGYQVKEGIGEMIEVYQPHFATCRGKKEA